MVGSFWLFLFNPKLNVEFCGFLLNDQHWLTWVDVREWWSSIRKSDQCLSVWTIAALGTHPDPMSIPLVNHVVEKVKVRKKLMQWSSKVQKPILLVAPEKVNVKVNILCTCTVWWQKIFQGSPRLSFIIFWIAWCLKLMMIMKYMKSPVSTHLHPMWLSLVWGL